MQIDQLTPDAAILDELGDRLTRVRKQRNQTQQALADEAGIGVATLRRIEDGQDGQLSSWLKILKALGMESVINALVPATLDSPMAEARRHGKRTRRGGHSARSGFSWGDEQP